MRFGDVIDIHTNISFFELPNFSLCENTEFDVLSIVCFTFIKGERYLSIAFFHLLFQVFIDG